ncbi:DNA mismatch repair endonuclease MutL [Paraferrimonas haliotis]|uniref:DNA mismatch repair endonuclease MutL n=1 Tax=Paraferrimonas haliotis TaxID=2013866 RepID=UPI000BA9142F|nr:DNA mismatch repair endonuclease MutL [Paraferrimonas haliotis]
MTEIQVLPPQLANQIAAGEVVERPASVVKELVENSLDANATRVDIEIQGGGARLIRIRDNGHGIAKAQLTLALERHATSKLASLEDLDTIRSFGFRGEALASVSSVSRLTIISRTKEQSEAWQAFAEGRDMQVQVKPAAHPVGTSIEVADLFFNTPARRRFLKSDKTEIGHIDEWLKRAALARPDIHFSLSHNGKLIRSFRPAKDDKSYLNRLTQVCGKAFVEQALAISCEHQQMALSGHLQVSSEALAQPVQYFYVNGRLVRDRLINHAVRQAFVESAQHQPGGFVLMLSIDPGQVDVNVHPAKHEVRFHQSRLVHDFIVQALVSAINQGQALPLDSQPQAPASAFQEPTVQPDYHTAEQPYPNQLKPSQLSSSQSVGAYSGVGASAGGNRQATSQDPRAFNNYQTLMTGSAMAETAQDVGMPPILDNAYWVSAEGRELSLLPVSEVARQLQITQLAEQLNDGESLTAQPLLLPMSLVWQPQWQSLLEPVHPRLTQLGIELKRHASKVVVKKVGAFLRHRELADVMPRLLDALAADDLEIASLLALLIEPATFKGNPQALWAQYQAAPEGVRKRLSQNALVCPWEQWLTTLKQEQQ